MRATLDLPVMDGALDSAFDLDVTRAARGDRNAYARLIDGTRRLVCSIALAVVRDRHASEDVAQEVYLAVWRDLPKLRQPESFLPWLRQLTRHRAHDHLRAARRRPDGEAVALETLADPRPDAGDTLAAVEEEAAVAAAFDELPDEAREVVTLFYREGRSTAQVASLLGLSEAAVKKRLQRARDSLRDATLARLGRALERSAPTAPFTATVLAALATGAPATASAAALAKASTVGKAAFAGKLALVAGPLGGALAGSLGVVMGMRRYFARARDDEERRELRRFRAVNVTLTLAAATTMGVAAWLDHTAYAMALAFFTFWALITRNYLVWLPRIIERRLSLERAEDPRAESRQRREKWLERFGLVSGTLMGGGTMLYVLWLLHRGPLKAALDLFRP